MVYSHDQERIFSWQCDVYTKKESKVGWFSACLLFFLAICGKLPHCDVTRSQTKALCQNNGRDLLCNHFSNPCPHPISKLNHLISPTSPCSYVLCEHSLTQNVPEQTALIAFFCKLANQLFDLMNDLFSSRFGNLPRPLKEVNFLKWSVRVIFFNLLKHFFTGSVHVRTHETEQYQMEQGFLIKGALNSVTYHQFDLSASRHCDKLGT